jgi:hypothetical protein
VDEEFSFYAAAYPKLDFGMFSITLPLEAAPGLLVEFYTVVIFVVPTTFAPAERLVPA